MTPYHYTRCESKCSLKTQNAVKPLVKGPTVNRVGVQKCLESVDFIQSLVKPCRLSVFCRVDIKFTSLHTINKRCKNKTIKGGRDRQVQCLNLLFKRPHKKNAPFTLKEQSKKQVIKCTLILLFSVVYTVNTPFLRHPIHTKCPNVSSVFIYNVNCS